jgi:hypothetical protein
MISYSLKIVCAFFDASERACYDDYDDYAEFPISAPILIPGLVPILTPILAPILTPILVTILAPTFHHLLS